MAKTVTTPYDVAEHLHTAEDMAAYLEARMEEAPSDAAFIAKALGDIGKSQGHVRGCRQLRPVTGKSLQRRCQAIAIPRWTRCSRFLTPLNFGSAPKRRREPETAALTPGPAAPAPLSSLL